MGTGIQRYATVGHVARALANPTRRYMLSALAARPCSMTDLIDFVLISQQGVSYHLGVLRDCGVIKVHGAYGPSVTYAVNAARLTSFIGYIDECLLPRDEAGHLALPVWPSVGPPPRPHFDSEAVGSIMRKRESG